MCETNKIQRKYKIVIMILVAIMLAGILVHSSVLWIINKFLSPEKFSYATVEGSMLIDMRLSMRRFAETANGMCSLIFLVGIIVKLSIFIRKRYNIELRKLFSFFFATVMAMFICVGPFVLTDKSFWGDYLFPVWSIVLNMILIFSIFLIIYHIKVHRKN